MSLINQPVFPHHDPVAQQLHSVLTQLYASGRAAQFVAQKAGIDVSSVFFEQSPVLIWKDLLDRASIEGHLGALIEQVCVQFPRSHWNSFLVSILSNQSPALDVEPKSKSTDGSAPFLRGSDSVSEPEALLFHDDLTIGIDELPELIRALNIVAERASAVCKLDIQCAEGMGYGTGFRISSKLLLTNWHVLHPTTSTFAYTVLSISARFGFYEKNDGMVVSGPALPCTLSSIAGSDADDWAVVEVAGLPSDIPVIRLATDASLAKLGGRAFVVQHPGGKGKRVAFARNTITLCDDKVVQYLSDTQNGSSGAPVFDERGRVIALHRTGGQPQEVLGQSPLKKNEGVAISSVVAGLRARSIPFED